MTACRDRSFCPFVYQVITSYRKILIKKRLLGTNQTTALDYSRKLLRFLVTQLKSLLAGKLNFMQINILIVKIFNNAEKKFFCIVDKSKRVCFDFNTRFQGSTALNGKMH